MKLFEGENIKEVVLKEGESLVIPANRFHIHSNPNNEKSITLWKFEGNVVEIIENIREGFERI